jgi:integral membrane protein (TIGR00529 family)
MINVLVGVVVALTIVIILIRRRIDMGLSLILGSIILGVFSIGVIEPLDILMVLSEGTIYSFKDKVIVTETIELGLLSTLIYVLARCMKETGGISRLIEGLRSLLGGGVILSVIPAVYGLMPVPGGALLSAPMIDEEGDRYKLDKKQKNLINIWFRHIWFPVYPVSSSMILICSSSFSGISISSLMVINAASFLAFIFIGFIMLRSFTGSYKKEETPLVDNEKRYNGLLYITPVVAPVIFYFILGPLGLPQSLVFITGVSISIIILYILVRIPLKDYIRIIKQSLTIRLFSAILGIMIFRRMFEAANAHVIISDLIGGLTLPSLIVIIMVPLLFGFITGYNLTAIALSYFLVQPFMLPAGLSILGFTSIVYMSSLIGYLISPIHLCNVLSSNYLSIDPTRIYRLFIPAALSVLTIQVIVVLTDGLFTINFL